MRVGFFCPDRVEVATDSCLMACRMQQRCLTKSSLKALSHQRQWTGKPSTTQLINGTRMEFLKLTRDYYSDPMRMAFALLGTKVHLGLADFDTDVSLLEEKFEEDTITGILDCYEQEGGVGILTDYKTWGSFRVAQALGSYTERVPDPSGAVYQRSGNGFKKGDSKMVTVSRFDPTKASVPDVELQLNRYRLFLEDAGFPVHILQLECVVRDGGTWAARDRGVLHQIYLIPVRRLPDDYVRNYFGKKAQALLLALRAGLDPPPCAPEETWEGRRCQEFCDVWEFCDVGRRARGCN